MSLWCPWQHGQLWLPLTMAKPPTGNRKSACISMQTLAGLVSSADNADSEQTQQLNERWVSGLDTWSSKSKSHHSNMNTRSSATVLLIHHT